MKLLVRYYRPMVYGNFTTLVFDDIDPEKTSISQLKRKILIKMRVEPKFQKLTMRGENQQILQLINENYLSSYNVSDGSTITLENTSNSANREHSHDFSEGFACKADVSFCILV